MDFNNGEEETEKVAVVLIYSLLTLLL